MKTLNLKSKDNLYDINIEYVEPKDINNINNELISYIENSTYILGENFSYNLANIKENTYTYLNEIRDDYNSKLELMDKKLYDMSINLRNTITYELDTTYTDLKIMNDLEELDGRLSYAIRNSNNIISTYNSVLENKLTNLTEYISTHIEEFNNLPTYNYWETYR